MSQETHISQETIGQDQMNQYQLPSKFPALEPAQTFQIWQLDFQSMLRDYRDDEYRVHPRAQIALDYINQSTPERLIQIRRYIEHPESDYDDTVSDITRDLAETHADAIYALVQDPTRLPKLNGEPDYWHNQYIVWGHLLQASLADLLRLVNDPAATEALENALFRAPDLQAADVLQTVTEALDRHRPALQAALRDLAEDLSAQLRQQLTPEAAQPTD